MSCDEEPIRASFLYVEKTPEIVGGDTLFANNYLAYKSLSEPLRAFIDTLTAVHDGSKAWTAGYGAKPQPGRNFPTAEHPVAPVHPATGRRFLRQFDLHQPHPAALPLGERRAPRTPNPPRRAQRRLPGAGGLDARDADRLGQLGGAASRGLDNAVRALGGARLGL